CFADRRSDTALPEYGIEVARVKQIFETKSVPGELTPPIRRAGPTASAAARPTSDGRNLVSDIADPRHHGCGRKEGQGHGAERVCDGQQQDSTERDAMLDHHAEKQSGARE